MNIDVDSHYTPPEIYENRPSNLKDFPRLVTGIGGESRLLCKNGERTIGFSATNFSLKPRLDAMNEAGYDKQCLNLALQSIPFWWVSPETELYLDRAWNDAVGKIVQENERFIGVAQIPCRDVDAAIEEADRAVKDLGFSAIHIEGNWAGKNIESYEWWPFFDKVEKLGVPLFSHPTGGAADGVFNPNLAAHEYFENFIPGLSQIMCFLIQHQVSMAGLIFSGLLDRCPWLKVLWLETDVGWVPPFAEMADGMYDAHLMYYSSGVYRVLRGKSILDTIKLKKRPSKYFKDNFYYSINYPSDLQLKSYLPLAIEKFGLRKRITIQSDYDHPEGSLDVVRRVRQLQELDQETREDICGRNAAELLNVKWAPSVYAW